MTEFRYLYGAYKEQKEIYRNPPTPTKKNHSETKLRVRELSTLHPNARAHGCEQQKENSQ
jgi:hypothetical protein